MAVENIKKCRSNFGQLFYNIGHEIKFIVRKNIKVK